MTVHTRNHQRARSCCFWLKKDLYQSHFLTVHIAPPTAGPSSSNSSTKHIWINDSVSYFIYFLFILFLIFILFVCLCIFQITATCETFYWCYLMFSWMCLYHFCYFNKKKAFNFVINIFIQLIYLNKLNCVYLFYLIIINILLYLGYIYFIFAFVYISPFFVTCKVCHNAQLYFPEGNGSTTTSPHRWRETFFFNNNNNNNARLDLIWKHSRPILT